MRTFKLLAVAVALLLGSSPVLAEDELPDTMQELLRQQEMERRWFNNPGRQRLAEIADEAIKQQQEKYREEEARKRRKKAEGWFNWW